MSIIVKKDGPVRTILINRPEVRNAVDRRTASELAEAFRQFEDDDAAKTAVLGGSGGHFCAGADLKKIAAGHPNRIKPDGEGPMGPTRMLMNKPVIAAVSGYAVAGGLELALWCDLRVMEETAVLGVFCRRWGVPLIDGGTIRLPRLIGLSRALDLILTGRPVEATEALQFGLANRVVPEGKALEAATEMAGKISAFPQICMRGDRMSAYQQCDLSFEKALANEFEHGNEAIGREAANGSERFSDGAGRHGKF